MVQFYMNKNQNSTSNNLNVYKVDNSKFKFSIENNEQTDNHKELDDKMDEGTAS